MFYKELTSNFKELASNFKFPVIEMRRTINCFIVPTDIYFQNHHISEILPSKFLLHVYVEHYKYILAWKVIWLCAVVYLYSLWCTWFHRLTGNVAAAESQDKVECVNLDCSVELVEHAQPNEKITSTKECTEALSTSSNELIEDNLNVNESDPQFKPVKYVTYLICNYIRN